MEVHNKFMLKAIATARDGKSPFGCVITSNSEIVAKACNTTQSTGSVIRHAELNAIDKLPETSADSEPELTLYSTAEPCPMCMGAIMYKRNISTLVYGVSIADISKFSPQIQVNSETINRNSFRKIQIIPFVLRLECLKLFE